MLNNPLKTKSKSTSTLKVPIAIWCVLFFLFPFLLKGQQLSTFNQYRDLQTIINPGAIPIDYFVYKTYPTTFLGTTLRNQWQNSELTNPPLTIIINADYLFQDIGAGGLLAGAYLIQDRNGIFETTGAYGKLAGIIDLYDGEISLGLNVGVVQNRLQFREASTGRAGIGIQDNFSGVFPDVGFGIFYRKAFRRSEDFIYMGISVPQVIGLDNIFKTATTTLSVNRIQHYYFTVGLLTYFLEDSFIEPTIWVKYIPNIPVSVDIGIRSQLAERLSIGLGFSTQSNSLSFNAGFLQRLDNGVLKIGFGYSRSLNKYGNLLDGSHEYTLHSAF